MWRFARRRALGALALVGVVLAYAGVRLMDLNRLVTTDEPFWLGASANFYRALQTGELVHTYQLEHPGVLTMWAGAIAFWLRFPEYAALVDHNLDGLGGMYSIESVLRGVGQDPLAIMVAAKVAKVLMQTVFFGIAILCLKKVAGTAIASTTSALIAFTPFLTGLDSALHVDGMAAITTFAGFCAIVLATERTDLSMVRTRTTLLWIAAGFLCATAWLSRYPALLLVGVVGLGLLMQIIAQQSPISIWVRWRTALIYGLTWLASSIVATVMLWPALWVAPRATLADMWSYSVVAAGKGHENPLIFMGVVKRGDPGWLFYPVSLLWRVSVTDWFGLIALLILGFWAWQHGYLTATSVRIALMAFAFITVFIVGQSFGAKKFDRYILPVYPLLTLIASIGLVTLGKWLAHISQRSTARFVPIALAISVNIATVGAILPYRLDFFSPIMGGPPAAVANMQMGWGQGGDQVVDYLMAQTGDGPVTVQTSAVTSAFTYFLTEDSPVQFRDFGLGTPAGWYETDFYVAGIQQTQRNIDAWYDLLRDAVPVHSVKIGGVSYFDIYSVKNLPLPQTLRQVTACNYQFGDEITLMQIVGRDDATEFYFLSHALVANQAIQLEIEITPPGGTPHLETVTLQPAAADRMNRITIHYAPSSLSASQIVIRATINGEHLPVTSPWTGGSKTQAATQSECYDADPPN